MRSKLLLFFAILTISVAILGIYFDTRIIPNHMARANVLFSFTQILVFLFLLLV